MKRTVMAVLAAGALLLSMGGSALAAEALGTGRPDHTQVAMRDAASGGATQAGGLNGGVVGSKGEFVVIAGGASGGVLGDRRGNGRDAQSQVLAGWRGGLGGDLVVIAGGSPGGVLGDVFSR